MLTAESKTGLDRAVQAAHNPAMRKHRDTPTRFRLVPRRPCVIEYPHHITTLGGTVGEQLVHDDEDATLIIGDNSATLSWDRGIYSDKLMRLMRQASAQPVQHIEHHPSHAPSRITFTFHYETKKVTL